MKILKIAKVGLITGTLGYECHGGMSVGDDKGEGGKGDGEAGDTLARGRGGRWRRRWRGGKEGIESRKKDESGGDMEMREREKRVFVKG